MQVIYQQELFRQYAQSINRPCLYLSCVLEEDESDLSVFAGEVTELPLAVPYLAHDHESILELACGKAVVIVCDDHTELFELFNLTVGDNGPTETNPYDGSVSVYAMTCDENGNLGTTNS